MAIQYQVSEDLLQEVVSRLLSAGSPEKIVLFGSRARGDQKPDSDLDVLVIDSAQGDGYRRALDPIRVPKDVVVWTPREVAAWANVPNHFITKVMREGRVLFERAPDVIRDSVPPKDQTDHAHEWLTLADRDLGDATKLLEAGGSPETVCFLAQQACEKYLKTVIAFHGADIERTHNLKDLRALMPQLGIDPGVDELTPYAVNGRYGKPATPEFARLAIELARQVRARVMAELP